MSNLLVWGALSIPALYLLPAYAFGEMGYGLFIHRSGQWSVGFLLLALSATPLRTLFVRASWPKLINRYRRAIGVASFAYALLHTLVYLEYKWGYGLIPKEALKPYLATGWVAMLFMLLLALTSNNYSVKLLRRRWKTLHNTVYIATALTFAHWWLTSTGDDLRPVGICLGVLCVLQLARLYKRQTGKSKKGKTS